MEVSVDDFCTNSFIVEDVCLEKPTSESLVDIEHDARGDEDVLNEVVNYATTSCSPFLSEGVISMKYEPPIDAPQDMIDESHPPIDKLQVLFVPYTPSFKRSLEKIQLLEYDGDSRGKKGKYSKKKRCIYVESTCAIQDESLCSRQRLLKD